MPNKHFNLAAFKDGTTITPEYMEVFGESLATMVLAVIGGIEQATGREPASKTPPRPFPLSLLKKRINHDEYKTDH